MPEAENIGQPAEEALQQDSLVEQLIADPSQGHPDVRTLVGFLGRSTLKGHVRLYLTTTLDVFVEIPEDAIAHRQSISSRQLSTTGTILWVKTDTTIEHHVRTSIHLRQAAFLGGNLNTASPAGRGGMTSTDATAIAGLNQTLTVSNDIFNTGCWANSLFCNPATFAPMCQTGGDI